jgi:hypothetical protein
MLSRYADRQGTRVVVAPALLMGGLYVQNAMRGLSPLGGLQLLTDVSQ